MAYLGCDQLLSSMWNKLLSHVLRKGIVTVLFVIICREPRGLHFQEVKFQAILVGRSSHNLPMLVNAAGLRSSRLCSIDSSLRGSLILLPIWLSTLPIEVYYANQRYS